MESTQNTVEEKQEEVQDEVVREKTIDIEESGVNFDAEITGFKLENGVALFEIRPEDSERTYVSTMEATVDITGKSQFENFVEEQGIEDLDEPFNELPVPCQVVSKREDDIVKFEIESLEIDGTEDDTSFEEISNFAFGTVAGLAPVANILLFSVMLSHTVGKDETTDTDIMFLFGMVVTTVTSFVAGLPLIV